MGKKRYIGRGIIIIFHSYSLRYNKVRSIDTQIFWRTLAAEFSIYIRIKF